MKEDELVRRIFDLEDELNELLAKVIDFDISSGVRITSRWLPEHKEVPLIVISLVKNIIREK
jgi:hypothetical protein